jgi:hypothetical protein
MNWLERKFSGHISFFNHRVVIFGFNAMHVALNIRSRWGWICFHPTIKCFGVWWHWYFYISDDATPVHSRFGIGPGMLE